MRNKKFLILQQFGVEKHCFSGGYKIFVLVFILFKKCIKVLCRGFYLVVWFYTHIETLIYLKKNSFFFIFIEKSACEYMHVHVLKSKRCIKLNYLGGVQ